MKMSVFNSRLKIALFVGSALFSTISFSHAGEWSGEIDRQPSEVDTLCVELDEKTSPHLQKICLDKISVKWTLKTTEQSSLVRSSISWKLQPTLWLRGDGKKAEKRPLQSFSKAIQAAYKETTPTDITLAAFFYPEIESAPDNTASAIDNMGIALEFEADVLSKSGDGYSFSAPSSPDWGALLIDAPQHVPCIISNTKKTRSYVPGDVSKELLRNGMSLSGLTICQASFADLKGLNNAIQKTCGQCKPGVGPLVADKGASLDELLGDVENGAPAAGDENADAALVTSKTTSNSLDDLLAGIEGEIVEEREQKAAQEQQNSIKAAAAEASANCTSLQNWLVKEDAQLVERSKKLCRSDIRTVNEAIENHKNAINRSTAYQRYSYSHRAHEDLDQFDVCIDEENRKIKKLVDTASETHTRLIDEHCIDPDGISAFSEARSQFSQAALAQLDRLRDLYENAENVIDELDNIEARNLTRLDAAASQNTAALTRNLSATSDWMGREVGDTAARSSALMRRHFRNAAPRAPEGSTRSTRGAAFSYPETSRRQNAPLVIDNGTLCNQVDEAARIACLSNNRQPAKPQNSGGSAKTQ